MFRSVLKARVFLLDLRATQHIAFSPASFLLCCSVCIYPSNQIPFSDHAVSLLPTPRSLFLFGRCCCGCGVICRHQVTDNSETQIPPPAGASTSRSSVPTGRTSPQRFRSLPYTFFFHAACARCLPEYQSQPPLTDPPPERAPPLIDPPGPHTKSDFTAPRGSIRGVGGGLRNKSKEDL